MSYLVDTDFYTLAFGLPGHMEMVVLLVLGLLVFGRRLPEVGRNVGRSIVEFKKGIKGIEDDVEKESSDADNRLDNQRNQKIADQDINASRVDDSKVAIGSAESDIKTD